ncbi:hypothetical protein Lesp02_53780 [Lentzea sp. NBRC 105346]|uniref:CHAP domain-containing protein n=1 Tax=Lentzea sp. NBRC 105346 TaxID=3032205 RepID=UPI0024A4324E|nr:CHAP domain-containing protein [Lentzea sp. NBRC 105346]GLZ33190.1 hypothetical protein Lesp02_53780 [Lentzea sp. NBRC 105346]
MRLPLLKTAVGGILAAVALVGISSEGRSISADPQLVAVEKSTDDETRRRIVETAEQEMNSKRNRETGDNCNSYSPNGKCQAWCADFAKFVWGKGGAKTDGVTSMANSFRDYGKKNHTWRNGPSVKQVRPGDAVTYRLNDKDFRNDHVGIVTAVDRKTGRITVISGNSGNKIRKVTIDPKKAQVTGFASPVAKDAKAKTKTAPKSKKPGRIEPQPAPVTVTGDHLSHG